MFSMTAKYGSYFILQIPHSYMGNLITFSVSRSIFNCTVPVRFDELNHFIFRYQFEISVSIDQEKSKVSNVFDEENERKNCSRTISLFCFNLLIDRNGMWIVIALFVWHTMKYYRVVVSF